MELLRQNHLSLKLLKWKGTFHVVANIVFLKYMRKFAELVGDEAKVQTVSALLSKGESGYSLLRQPLPPQHQSPKQSCQSRPVSVAWSSVSVSVMCRNSLRIKELRGIYRFFQLNRDKKWFINRRS